MNFNGHSCPKCGRGVTRNKRLYKCRCGWTFKEQEENYNVRLRKRFEEEDRKRGKC